MNVDVVKKYVGEIEQRIAKGLPGVGELCSYCHGADTTMSITGYRVCASCGAEMPKPFGYVYGVPVYDPGDWGEILAKGKPAWLF